MDDEERITIEEVINLIGDEVGKKYNWFLIEFDAQGVINEHLSVDDISEKVNLKLGYYEASWDLIKQMSKTISAVVDFHLVGFLSKEDFINEVDKINQKAKNWTEITCELDFCIEDGHIWEINGTDEFLVKRLKKTFSQLPTLLM
jgi:hypothetical protein